MIYGFITRSPRFIETQDHRANLMHRIRHFCCRWHDYEITSELPEHAFSPKSETR